MLLYSKYDISRPCRFGQFFFKLNFENLFITPWPNYATNQNGFNNFGRGSPCDHSCEVWSSATMQFCFNVTCASFLGKPCYEQRERTSHSRSEQLRISYVAYVGSEWYVLTMCLRRTFCVRLPCQRKEAVLTRTTHVQCSYTHARLKHGPHTDHARTTHL